MPFKLGII